MRAADGHTPRPIPTNAAGRPLRAAGQGLFRCKELHGLLEDLTDQVIKGELPTAVGAVANQLVNTRIRLLEYERGLREKEDLEVRMEALEQAEKERPGQRRWRRGS